MSYFPQFFFSFLLLGKSYLLSFVAGCAPINVSWCKVNTTWLRGFSDEQNLCEPRRSLLWFQVCPQRVFIDVPNLGQIFQYEIYHAWEEFIFLFKKIVGRLAKLKKRRNGGPLIKQQSHRTCSSFFLVSAWPFKSWVFSWILNTSSAKQVLPS